MLYNLQVRQIIIHEDYDFIHFDGDIALLELESAVELTTRVQPACLPSEDTSRENVRDGKKGIVSIFMFSYYVALKQYFPPNILNTVFFGL